MTTRVTPGDCRIDLEQHGPFDMLVADPPYGDTSLAWDKCCEGWIEAAGQLLKPNGSMWVFGSMRFFQEVGFGRRWKLAQDIVWEKHNGSGFHADRFKRVHEHACQYYLASSPWASVYNDVQKTMDATPRAVRRKKRPAHTGHIEASHYVSEDGGPRIMRSVIYMPSMHGRAIHPTEKPAGLLEILIRTSCPPDGIVGDLFAGSGAAGEAAMRAGRRYAGCEIDAAMAHKANDRLAAMLPLSTVTQADRS
jgi:site-specific DNA-methyltransferase (adenine-specific)